MSPQEKPSLGNKLKNWGNEHSKALKSVIAVGATGLALAGCGGPSQAGADHAPTSKPAATASETPGTPAATETAPATTTPETDKLGVDIMQSKAFLDLTPADQAEVQKALDPSLTPENYSNQDQAERAMVGNVIMKAYGDKFVNASESYVIDGRTMGHNYVPAQGGYVNTAKTSWDFALNTKAKDITNNNASAAYFYYKFGGAVAFYIAANGGPVDVAKKLEASLTQNPYSTADTTHGNLAAIFQELDNVALTKSDPNALNRYPNDYFAGQDVTTKAVWINGQLMNPDDTGNLSYSLNQFTYKTVKGADNQAWTLREADPNPNPLVQVQQ